MRHAVVIVGGGQAGLSVARYLKAMGQTDIIVLDQHAEAGTSWRERYDSLQLDSYAHYSHLEGFPFPGDPKRRPNKDEVADYLAAFAAHFDIQIVFNTTVTAVTRDADGFAVSTADGQTYAARQVVLATGPFHRPFVPSFAKDIPDTVLQLHSSGYKNPDQLRPGATLIVGGGNSGAEFAEEIADSGRAVIFSFKRKLQSVSSTPLHQWLAYRLGLAHLPRKSLLGALALWYTKGKAVGVDVRRILRHPRIALVGEVLGVRDGAIECKSRSVSFGEISNLIWATGFTDDSSLIRIDGFDSRRSARGVSNIPGLYLLNIRWQHSKSSSHLAGISRDAKRVAQAIVRALR